MKKAFCIYSLILFNQIAFSQDPVIKWQKTIGGSGVEALHGLIKTTDGGYICGGFSDSNISGDKSENSRGNYDYWIVKLDELGTIQWQRTIGGSNSDLLTSLAQTADGGCICGGTSSSGISGDKTENGLGGADYWIVKIDVNGNIEWQNTIGGSGSDNLTAISQTSDKGYICCGNSASGISGDKTEKLISGFYWDYWIIKLDSIGNIQWQNTIGGKDADAAVSISQTTDMGYICAGSSSSGIWGGDKTEPNIGWGDYWIVKLDSTGNIQWQNTIGGSGVDMPGNISQTNDMGFICSGHSASDISGDKTENCMGSFDYWILKLDSAGNIIWQNTIGGNADDAGNTLGTTFHSQTIDGGYLCVTSSLTDISGDKTGNNNGYWDCWIFKLDNLGNIQWQNSFGGADNETSCINVQPTDDGAYICGMTSYSGISGDKTEMSKGDADYWIIKTTFDFNTISGKIFADLNSNSIQDNGELAISHQMVLEMNTGNFGFSDDSGLFNIIVLDSGNFVTTPGPLSFYSPVPSSCTAHFSGTQQTDSLNNFACQPTGNFNNLKIKLTPIGGFNPGSIAYYQLDYQNLGTTTLSGNISFYMDSSLTYLSADLAPVSITTDSIAWNTGNLVPFQGGRIIITLLVNQTTPVGTLIYPISRIFPLAGDAEPQNNTSSWEIIVTGSIDPNDIMVNRNEILTTELPAAPWLEYVIRFQNTGTDTATVIKVYNTVDTNRLDLNSFEFEASSHPVNINYNFFMGRFEFSFPNITLPDSNVNEQASHGFVRYRIKPLTTLLVNDKIKNNASIYFDFNSPIQTNTVITSIVLPSGIFPLTQTNKSGIGLFPNPTSNYFTIQLSDPNESILEISLHDLLGRPILKSHPESKKSKSPSEIDISPFQKGIYIYEVITGDKKIYRGKVIKQ